ncbi:MAG TPA: alginate lyase family protein [Chitinophagaceae bacterium]|nr:alginate lyase family protein [Chitinophagaceae bacterium]
MMRIIKRAALFLVALGFIHLHAQTFIHPGLLHSKEDLDRMKDAVAKKQEPVYSGYLKFIQNPVSHFEYKMLGPLKTVGRNPTAGQKEYDSDANAAHQNAVMWCITGDKRYADKAIEIINAWSSTLTSITGRDAVLMAGLGPFKMVNAAEIIRYTNAGWQQKDIELAEKNFKEIIYPVIKNFAPFANGNWDAAAVKTMMSIAVFCNDRNMFERALHYYVDGHGNGCLTNYIINNNGQIQESGRDQAHTQLGIAMLAECCEIAWHQGLDLYGYRNNLLLNGFEYVARFNLGNDDVFFTPWLDRTGKYQHKIISQNARNNLRAIYEQVLNHYSACMKIDAPFVKQAVEKIRPEGPGNPGADHPGYGTLYYAYPAASVQKPMQNIVPASPGAVIAKGASKQISLTWIASRGATNYTVKRATKNNGTFSVIATVSTAGYIDSTVKQGVTYYYTVTASNAFGTSKNSFETSVAAGFPFPWKEQTIGITTLQGYASYNGNMFTIEGAGMGLNPNGDSVHYLYFPLNKNAEISIRFVPQFSSQFTSFGLMLRSDLTAASSQASLIICPAKTNSIEEPNWQIHWVSRDDSEKKLYADKQIDSLKEPVVIYGRVTGEYRLKLKKNGNILSGFVSEDGKKWKPAGTSIVKNKKVLLGIVVASGMPNKTTTVMFDNVKIEK